MSDKQQTDGYRVTRERLLVLAGTVSPYMWRLFSGLSEGCGVQVLVAHVPRHPTVGYSHEERERSLPTSVEAISYGGSPFEALRVAPLLMGFEPQAVLVLGHATPANILLPLLFRASRPAAKRFYFADTSGEELLRSGMTSLKGWAFVRLKAILLPRLYEHAFSLGASSDLAYDTLQLPHSDLPLYGVDFRQMDQARPAERKAGFTVLCVARLVKRKGIAELLQAWAMLKPGDHELVLVGDGPDAASLRDLAEDLGVHARFVGAVPRHRVGSYYKIADLVVVPSLFEPWGIVVTEALGMGVPVIASPVVGSATSLVQLGTPGIMLRSPRAPDLAEALEDVMTNHSALRRQARRAAGSVRERFGVENIASRLAALLGRPRTPTIGRATPSPRTTAGKTASARRYGPGRS